jgi:hypothetical protein
MKLNSLLAAGVLATGVLSAATFLSTQFQSHPIFAASPSRFVLRIENVSTPQTLKTPNGNKAVLFSPGDWAIHSEGTPIFNVNQRASDGLEKLAEDGFPVGLVSELPTRPIVKQAGVFSVNTGVPYLIAGDIGPGQAYEVVLQGVSPGDRVSFVTMFVESNDWFYGSAEGGIALFNGDNAVSGDVTSQVGLWDAGTERDEMLGMGMSQAPRQPRRDTGAAEGRRVMAVIPPGGTVTPDYRNMNVPEIAQAIRVTLTPQEG